jgi:uncharacterized RDD family membrane protein YckC
MKNKIYEGIGFIKNILICLYDLMLLFSVLFFLTIPILLFSDGAAITNSTFYQIYLFIIIVTYYSWFWINHGQTLGMKSWRTYLVNVQANDKISISQCLLRIIFALVGGHLLLLFSKKSLQDVISKTRIVKKNNYRNPASN